MNTIKEFFKFIRQPIDQWHPNQNFDFKFKTFGILFIFEMLMMVFLVIPITLLEQAGVLNLENHSTAELMTQVSPLQVLFIAAFIAPLLEEFFFRFFLKYERSLFSIIAKGDEGKQKTRQYWDNNFKRYFYLSTALFGLVHITNFMPFNWTIILLAPLLCLPQLFMGSIAGFLRVRFGFFWGFLLHALHNLVLAAASLYALSTPSEKVNTDNDNYSIQIEEVFLSNNKGKSQESSNENSDNINTRTYELKNHGIMDIYHYTNKEQSGSTRLLARELNNKKFNINLNLKNDSLDHKNIIKKEIEKAYNLEFLPQKRSRTEWELNIQDSSLLEKYSVQDSLLRNFSSEKVGKQMSMKSHKTKQLAIWLNNKYRERISNGITLDGKYDFKIPLTRRFKQMQDSLRINYGLELIEEKIEVEEYVIRKKKKEE